MKKLFSNIQWTEHSKRCAIKKLDRKRIKDRRLNSSRYSPPRPIKPNYIYNFNYLNEQRVVAPNHFSIINNVEEMLEYFDHIKRLIKRGERNIFLDLSNVQQLTEDALLYMIALFDSVPGVQIQGNVPKDQKCADLIKESGFFNFVRSTLRSLPLTGAVFAIESGQEVEPKIAAKVIKFVQDKIPSIMPPHLIAKKLFTCLIECMANTNNHAYISKKKYSKWLLIGQYNHLNNNIHFTFLDTGIGISASLRTKLKYKFNHIISQRADAHLIYSALTDEFKTRTGKRERGKGLPSIYLSNKSSHLKKLKIISNKGYIDCFTDTQKRLKRRFEGTLLSWDISGEKV